MFGEGKDFQNTLAKVQKYMKTYAKADDIPDSELPESFDWRNVDGYDFTGDIRD